MIQYTTAILKRFWPKVQKTETCWLWTGTKTPLGYGVLTINCKSVAVYRFSYELYKGEIPKGYHIDHLCRNPSCLNPAHLEAVTPKENTLRGFSPAANYARRTHCGYGHPFDEENTGYYKVGNHKGKRYCKTCNRAKALKHLHKPKQ